MYPVPSDFSLLRHKNSRFLVKWTAAMGNNLSSGAMTSWDFYPPRCQHRTKCILIIEAMFKARPFRGISPLTALVPPLDTKPSHHQVDHFATHGFPCQVGACLIEHRNNESSSVIHGTEESIQRDILVERILKCPETQDDVEAAVHERAILRSVPGRSACGVHSDNDPCTPGSSLPRDRVRNI